MRKKTFQITIPEPCDQKWEDMTPQSKGRFCGQCTKTIVDFSQKTDREIAAAFKQSEGQLCGRFTNDQLNRDIILATALKNNSQWKATGLMLSAMLTMSACNNEDRMTTGEIAPVEQFENHQYNEIPDEIDELKNLQSLENLKWDRDLTPSFTTGMVMSSNYDIFSPPPSPMEKYKLVFGIALILGGILLFIFVLEMIVRATM